MKVVNRDEGWIGFRLNILGVRVWKDACQLVARTGDQWVTLGQARRLPVQVPRTADELREAAADPLRLTAYQYVSENKQTDLAALLAKQKTLESAMRDGGVAVA